MADDKNAREAQADGAQRRQRERAVDEALERGDEEEPVVQSPGRQLGGLDDELDEETYPITTAGVVEEYGDREVEAQNGLQSVEEVLAHVDDEVYESPDEVRQRLLGELRR